MYSPDMRDIRGELNEKIFWCKNPALGSHCYHDNMAIPIVRTLQLPYDF